MEPWRSQSSPSKQVALAIGCAVAGLVMAVGFRHYAGGAMSDGKAGFLLGLLLLVIGVAGLVVQGRQVVVVDPQARVIAVEDKTLLGTKRRTIAFGEVAGISIGYLGKRSNWVSMYHLVLKLRSGEEYPLFAPGRFYSGASDRSVVEGWRRRLEGYLRGAS